jgi:hypothetical protein
MKTYQSIVEGTWLELKPVQLTEEQHALLISTDESDREDQTALGNWIKSEREAVVGEEKATQLTAFYETKKPELKESDTYQLIALDLSEKEGQFTGILNCRVNGKHMQIRF